MFSTPNHDSWLEFAGLAIADFPELAATRRRVWLASSFIDQFEDMESWPKDQDKFKGPKGQYHWLYDVHNAKNLSSRVLGGWDVYGNVKFKKSVGE